MENAAAAVNSLFSKGNTSDEPEVMKPTTDPSTPTTIDGDVNKTVEADAEVAPAVEHTHVKKQHETREQTFVEREKHQDHYHTTIQPLKDSEILPEKHESNQRERV